MPDPRYLARTDRQTGSRTSQRRSAKRQRPDAPRPKTKGQTLQDLGLPNTTPPTTGHNRCKQHGRSKSPRNFPIHNDKQHHRSCKDPNSTSASDTAGIQPGFSRPFPLRGMALGAPRLRDRYLSNSPVDCLRGIDGGAERDRTDDLLLAKQALSQLSYGPFAPTRAHARVKTIQLRWVPNGTDCF